MISFSFSALRPSEDFSPRLSVQPARDLPAYYQLWIDYHMSVCLSITDEQRLQLLDVLSSAPPLPKSDAQIDAEREDNATALPGSGDVEIPAAGAHLRRYMSECSSGLWRVGGPDAEF